MTTLENKRRVLLRRIRITGWSALTALAVTIVCFLIYFHTVFMADRESTLEVFRDPRVTVATVGGSIVLAPANGAGSAGLLYFPGARVDPYSYLHSLVDVAASGVTVVVMEPLFNMALFDSRDLGELTSAAPTVQKWTLAGHSLGGVRACMLADHPDVTGLVLLASYCANDVSGLDIEVRQILASGDGLIDPVAVEQAREFLPATTTTTTLDGANHASFGTYGDQPGDGPARLSKLEMREALTDLIVPLTASD